MSGFEKVNYFMCNELLFDHETSYNHDDIIRVIDEWCDYVYRESEYLRTMLSKSDMYFIINLRYTFKTYNRPMISDMRYTYFDCMKLETIKRDGKNLVRITDFFTKQRKFVIEHHMDEDPKTKLEFLRKSMAWYHFFNLKEVFKQEIKYRRLHEYADYDTLYFIDSFYLSILTPSSDSDKDKCNIWRSDNTYEYRELCNKVNEIDVDTEDMYYED